MVTAETENQISDADVVAKALVQSEFFGILVERYAEKITRYIRRLGVSVHEDRQDVLQEIFIKVYKNLNDFDSAFSFSSWIYRIAHNEAISWYRKKSSRPEGHLVDDVETVMLFVPDNNLLAEEQFDIAVNSKVLQGALLNLDIKYRDPLILRFFEHKEYDEISDILKIPIGTVGTLISRGKKKLEGVIAKEKILI